MFPEYNIKAIIKFNNGKGALLCNSCRRILAFGLEHDNREHFCQEYSLVCRAEDNEDNS